MPCQTYDELQKEIVDAMCAEDLVRGMPSGRRKAIGEKAHARQSESAHSRVAMLDWSLNRHIRECGACKADNRTPVNNTEGQF